MKIAVAVEKLMALVGRQVKVTMLDGSTPSGKLTDIKTHGLVINDGENGELAWPSSIELDDSFVYPLSSLARVELAAASSSRRPQVIRQPDKPAAPPAPVKPTKVHRFREG